MDVRLCHSPTQKCPAASCFAENKAPRDLSPCLPLWLLHNPLLLLLNSSLATLASFVPQNIKHAPVSGPPNLLNSMPGMLFPKIYTQFTLLHLVHISVQILFSHGGLLSSHGPSLFPFPALFFLTVIATKNSNNSYNYLQLQYLLVYCLLSGWLSLWVP